MPAHKPAEQLQQFLQHNIPLARATGASIQHYNNAGLSVTAPLSLNNNHHGTAFGGSLYVVALAAGWGLVHLLVSEAQLSPALYVRHAEADYLGPVDEDLQAHAQLPSAAARQRFFTGLENDGRAQIEVFVTMDCKRKRAFELRARFAAVAEKTPAKQVSA